VSESSASSGQFDRSAAQKANDRSKYPRRDPIERSRAHPKSLRLAINAKCYDCEGRDADPKWQERVGSCVVTGCPLWPVRPYRRMGSK
jgi:hypothetical protein